MASSIAPTIITFLLAVLTSDNDISDVVPLSMPQAITKLLDKAKLSVTLWEIFPRLSNISL